MKCRFRVLFSFMLLLALLFTTAGANSLPRPYLIFRVLPPQSVSEIAMLSPEPLQGGSPHVSKASLAAFREAVPEGWYLWDAHPTMEGFWGSEMPQTFRLLLRHADGSITVTGEATRTRPMQTFTIHADTSEVTTLPTVAGLAMQFVCTCFITLLVEAVLLLLFEFPFRENLRAFLLVNLVTQLVMTLTFGSELVNNGSYSAYFLALLVEVPIFAAEALSYTRLLHGGTRRRCVLYALCANAASFLFGIWLTIPVYDRIAMMM